MKIATCKSVFFLLILQLAFGINIHAQDEARAAWQVTNFDITVANLNTERALNARAALTVRNVGRGPGSTLTLRINTKAEIKTVTIGAATAAYRMLPESRGGGQRILINLPATIAANDAISVTVEYRLPIEDNAGTASISPVGSQFLPAAMWYPAPNTAFAVRGPDYAPFRLTVKNATAISSGVEKSGGANSVFEQTLNAQPFFVVGDWDRVDRGAPATGLVALVPKGAGDDERKQAQNLMALAANARSFYAALFGAAPDVPIRLIAVRRGAGFDDAGAILLSEGALRRKKVDSITALGIAEAVARIWIGANTAVRGEGYGVLREGLARYAATLFIEKEFGADAANEERARQRLAYASIAKRDAPLARTTALDPTYFNSVGNKGAMVWRLAANLMGREAFLGVVRDSLSASQKEIEGFSLARLRTALNERGGATVKGILDSELDQSTDMDLLIGLPQQQGGQWVAALRNLGSFDAKVTVIGITTTGQQVASQGTIPAHDFAQVSFSSPAQISRVEVDPEKLYPQLDYTNDVAPRQIEVSASLGEAMRLFGTQDYAKAESLTKQLVAIAPEMQEARVLFARALLAQNKLDQADREFKQLADNRLPTPSTLAWSAIGLGEVALRRGQAKDAARLFNDAVRADAEYAATLNARAARIRAEAAAAMTPPIDESAKAFVAQLDTAIRTGRQNEILPMVVTGELKRFIQQVVGTQPELWETRVLRTEALSANEMAVDVSLQTKQLGVDHSGTAVFVLARVAGAWKLNAIELFEVK
jgi:tetratricopeptide (TPR) repeat protein